MMNWRATYTTEKAPCKAMAWDEYERLLMREWGRLLNSKPSPKEQQIQAFLELHPSMVPGAFNMLGGESGHWPWYGTLISQAPLPSYRSRVPDFMWLSNNSETEEPVLIEIEAPGKTWFTKSGRQTSALTQALIQIGEWKAWFSYSNHVGDFKAFYRLDSGSWMRRCFRPSYVLIYGRRSEANARPDLTEKRAFMHADDVILMTYDRLHPNPKASQLVCCKVDAQGTLHAVSVPPTLQWMPGAAEDRLALKGLEGAIERNPCIKSERKAFLIRRLPYWNDWAATPNRGPISTGSAE